MDEKELIAYKKMNRRQQKVRITFETTIPGYNADGDPLQALAYIAFKIAQFVFRPGDIHNVTLEQIEEFSSEKAEKE